MNLSFAPHILSFLLLSTSIIHFDITLASLSHASGLKKTPVIYLSYNWFHRSNNSNHSIPRTENPKYYPSPLFILILPRNPGFNVAFTYYILINSYNLWLSLPLGPLNLAWVQRLSKYTFSYFPALQSF